MKRLIVFIVTTVLLCTVQAEDVLQIRPCTVSAGLTDDDEVCLELLLVNESFPVANLQFDLLLPDGVEYSYWDYGERIPFTKKGKKVDYDFDVQTNKMSSGYTRFMFIPGGEMRPIENEEGVLLYLYINTASDLKSGVYPIKIDNINLDETVTHSLHISNVVSYLSVEDNSGESPINTESTIDLSNMTGYVPSFIVEQLNADMAANDNLSIINLSGATDFGAEIALPENVVCTTATETTLNRTFTPAQWSTVCLPFALGTEKVANIKDSGVEIEKFSSYNSGNNTVVFAPVSEMEANVPYLVKCEAGVESPFKNLTGITLAPEATPQDVIRGSMTMQGTFVKKTLNSSVETTYYAFNADNGEFVQIGTNATVPQFRAYMILPSVAEARSLKVVHGDDDTTGINTMPNDNREDANTHTIYDLSGRRVYNGEKTTSSLKKGIYIVNNKKMMVK